MVREMLQQRWGGSRVEGRVGFGEEAVFIGNVDQMAKFMASRNAKHLTRIVSNKYLQGLIVDKVCKQCQIGLGSRVE